MTAAEQAWIDNSLARLEALHEQRESIEAAGQLDKLAEIDEEIASLTEVLEAVAEESGPIDVAANEQAPVAVAQPFAQPMAQPVAQPMAQPAAQPFAAPAQPFAAPAQPFAAPTPAMAPPQPAPMMDVPMDDDMEFKKSKAPLFIAAAVILVGGGVTAFLALGGAHRAEEPAAPAAPTETKVITAAEVPEDTQEPVVAKGADADRTPGMEIKESSSGPAKSSNRSGKRRNGGKRSSKKDSDGRNLDLGKSRDPLAGV